MLETRSIAAAENVDTDRQFMATELRLDRILRWINVDQLDHEVPIRAGGGRDKVCDWRSLDLQRSRQHVSHISQHVWAPIYKALIAYQPGAPGVIIRELHRSRPVGNRLRRIGHVGITIAYAGRCFEREFEIGLQVKRF